ncbi:oligosaccharide flippase family protein [Methylotenera sp. 1P/1]|uniref:oligosaccharide flippase family protein n=1 Tax=Methylotenera sp. 1P/1 TaxID=1131551 RepID=UPI00039FAB8A|nr:oligosaccharide flippase family protein [Methylotenera sp. 1P/1]
MLKNTLYMGITTAAKLLAGIAVFVIMARVLGPHDFGVVIYAFTLGSIFVLLVDYGFSQQLLRDIGTTPSAINKIMGRVLIAKLVLSLALLAICAIYLVIFPKDFTTKIVFLALLCSSLIASFSEFLNVGFRGVGQFKLETNLATLGAIIHFALIVAMLLIKPDVYWVAFAFVVSRCIYLCMSWYAYQKHLGNIETTINSNEVIKTLKAGFPYAADAGFTNFFYQVDTIIVNHYLGFAGVGMYQAATKWMQGAMQFAPVLSNVYLPTIASHSSDGQRSVAMEEKLCNSMLFIGFFGWLFFTFFAEYASDLIYGESYKSLAELWKFIGLLIFLRYFAATQGVLLTAYGLQKVRVFAQVCALGALILTAPYLIKQFNLAGILVSLIASIATLILVYSIYGNRNGIKYRNHKVLFTLSLLVAVTFICLVIKNA